MSEIPPPHDDTDISMQRATDVARDVIGAGMDPDVIGFLPLFTNPEEETAFMGRGLYNDAQTMMRRYPISHASNIAEVINAARTDKTPALIGDLRAGNVDLTEEEITRLGERRSSTPLLSVARIPRTGFTGLARHEPSRQELARWLSGRTDPLLDEINTIELRLFNDAAELAIGEGQAKDPGQPPTRWVMRPKSYTSEEFARLQERLAALEGLVPQTHLIRGEDGQSTLTLSEWISGQHVTADERNQFEALLRDRGISPDYLETHEENIIRRPDGHLLYVDGDYLEI